MTQRIYIHHRFLNQLARMTTIPGSKSMEDTYTLQGKSGSRIEPFKVGFEARCFLTMS